MNRKLFLSLFASALLVPSIVVAEPTASPEPAAEPEAVAQNAEKTTWQKILEKMPKFSGYLQAGYNWTHNDVKSTSSFQAKRLRLIMDGNVGEKFDFRLQIEAFNGIGGSTNGNGQKNIQVMDAFATWKICPEFKVRVGQFYTPLGYENYDISPATLESVDFSNIVYRIACRNPYEYNFVDYGRDLGIMFMGDAFDSGKGFRYLHYDVALTNGSIPCKDDSNKAKDLYVSATIRPFKHFSVKGTFNIGEYKSQKLAGGNGAVAPEVSEDPARNNLYNPMNRYVVGAWYNNPTGLDVRAEYGAMKSTVRNVDVVKESGAYVLVGYHFGKFLPVVRWDMYKDDVAQVSTNNYNRIMLGCSYAPHKNVKFQLNYGHFMYKDNGGKTAKEVLGYDKSEQLQVMAMFKF